MEYASQEDSQRAIRELSETPLLGRPVFIREVMAFSCSIARSLRPYTCFQDREHESRFGATPVPGKIGMAMAGAGLHAAPPPRPPFHNGFAGGGGQNPGNQLYVGNVCIITSPFDNNANSPLAPVPSWMAGPKRPLPVCGEHRPR